MKYLDETGLAYLWDKIKAYVDSHSGGGGGSTTPAIVSLGKKIADDTATQSISTTLTKLNIGTTTTVNTDPSAFTITAGRVTCNRAGVVRVDASAYVAHGTSAGYQSLHIYKNGAEKMSTREYATGSFIGTLNCAQYFTVEAGDYFEIYGRANASSRFYTENKATTLDVMYIG